MNRTDAFAKDFCERMNGIRPRKYEWEPAGRPTGKGHESVDIIGRPHKKGKRLILVEAELRKDAPLTNVVKIWRWVAHKELKGKFVLVQAFSRYYKMGDTKRENAEFVGKFMQAATGNTYIPVSFNYNPYKHGKRGAGRRQKHAYALADKIRRKLKAVL